MRTDTETWRRIIYWLLLASFIGTGAELLLLEHTEDWWQLAPLVLLGLGALALVLRTALPRPGILRLFQALMALFVVSGVVGLFLHYRGNAEFELEMSPALAGWDLFRKALEGATPTLAPGAMTQFGVLGLLYGFRHPLLSRTEARTET